MRNKKVLEKIQGIEDKINKFIPINTINLENKMYAVEAAIDSQVAASNILNEIVWNQWIIINNWANYFANVFKYEAEDFKHNVFLNRAIRYGFIYGRAYVWNNNGTPEIVGVVNWDDKDVVEISIITEDMDYSLMEKTQYFYNSNKGKRLTVPKSQIIVYRFNSLGWSSFIVLQPIIKLEQQIMKALYNEAIMLPTRLLHDTEAGQTDTRATKQLLEFNSPVLHKTHDGTDKFYGLTINTNNQDLLNTIEYAKNYYYDILGRRTNSDFKRAHSLDAELEASESNFEILERDRYMFLKRFLREYSKMFRTSILLENSIGEFKDVFEKDIIKEKKEVNNGTNNVSKPSGN